MNNGITARNEIFRVVAISLLFFSTNIGGGNCFADNDVGEAIATTIAQLIPELVDEQVLSVDLNLGLNRIGEVESKAGFGFVYVKNHYLLGARISGGRISHREDAIQIYGGLLLGQRRFNSRLGKYYIDMLMGVGENSDQQLFWVFEPRLDLAPFQTKKLFVPDLLVGTKFGIKSGVSLRLINNRVFSDSWLLHSAVVAHIGLFIST